MADIFLFATQQPVEVVRILDSKVTSQEIRKFRIRLINGLENIFIFNRWRRVENRDNGLRSITIRLMTEKSNIIGIQRRRVIDDYAE